MSDKDRELQHDEFVIKLPIVTPTPIGDFPDVGQRVDDAVEHYKYLGAYKKWLKNIVVDPAIMGGQPVFKGTRITVRRIASLKNRGESTEAILDDYPCLTEQDIEFSQTYYSLETT